eukprot:TRINITY_DN849_c0_g5_i1.p1 TRINITY_DN849_c0_g5~~TRINITY_DN849_c0_g5_i1.p1  ORF type:complete len:691 (+),score=271.48 TRINITY_DN849_c0_g5_i1:96-2168(+)
MTETLFAINSTIDIQQFLFDFISFTFTHSSFILYFMLSLQDTPIDLAFRRLFSCTLLPYFLIKCFSFNIIFGLIITCFLWRTFLSPVAFSPLRIPSGLLKKIIYNTGVQIKKISKTKSELEVDKKKSKYADLHSVNPYVVAAYLQLITPLFNFVNYICDLIFGSTLTRYGEVEATGVSWLFYFVNCIDNFFKKRAKFNLVYVNPRQYESKCNQIATKEIFNELEDLTFEGIKLFCEDTNKRPEFCTATGKIIYKNYFHGFLDTKLSIAKYLKFFPEICDIPIRKPLIIIGLPRTGSTFLQQLLAQDNHARHLRFWEMNMPIPPPRKETYFTDPRIEQVQQGLKSSELVSPGYMKACAIFHEIKSGGIEEELIVLQTSGLLFSHYYLTGQYSDYKKWFFRDDNKQFAYRYLRRLLQILSSEYKPKTHWLLKAPVHSLWVDAMMKEFPDACVVVTHRDPRHVIPSWTKFQTQMLAVYTDRSTNLIPLFSHLTLDLTKEMAKRIMEYRKNLSQLNNSPFSSTTSITISSSSSTLNSSTLNSSTLNSSTFSDSLLESQKQIKSNQFIDVMYEDLVSDPIGVVKKIYNHFNMPMTTKFENNLKDFIQQSKQKRNSTPKVEHTLPQIQLTDLEIFEQFENYYKCYYPKTYNQLLNLKNNNNNNDNSVGESSILHHNHFDNNNNYNKIDQNVTTIIV